MIFKPFFKTYCVVSMLAFRHQVITILIQADRALSLLVGQDRPNYCVVIQSLKLGNFRLYYYD